MGRMRNIMAGWRRHAGRGAAASGAVPGGTGGTERWRLSRRGRWMLAKLTARFLVSIVVLVAVGAGAIALAGRVSTNLSDALLQRLAPWVEVETPTWLLDPAGAEDYEQSVAASFHDAVAELRADGIRVYLVRCLEGGTEPADAALVPMLDMAQEYLANHQDATASEAVWETQGDLARDTELVDRLYPMAAEATGYDYADATAAMWTAPDEWSVTYQAHADGTVERRDYTLYNVAMELVVVVGVLAAAGAVVAVVVLNLRRPVRAYDALFQAVQGLLADPSAPMALPRGLEEDELALKRIAERAQTDRRVADEAEQRKSELVAYLAHDIKTPLTSVAGYLSLIEESPDLPAERLTTYARRALDRTYRLDAMLDELFEITRFNLGRIVVEREHLDLALFCGQVADELAFQGSARGVTMRVEAPEGVVVFVDAEKLSRALANILKNAVAYADEGSEVTLIATVEPEGNGRADTHARLAAAADAGDELTGGGAFVEDDDAAVALPPSADEPPSADQPSDAKESRGRAFSIAVTDHGREIAPEHLERIFERFFRADDARGTTTGGAGLGLAIAREIVRAHGGDIQATSEGGITTFTLRIPGEDASA